MSTIDTSKINIDYYYMARLHSEPLIFQPIEFESSERFSMIGNEISYPVSEIAELGDPIGLCNTDSVVIATVTGITTSAEMPADEITLKTFITIRVECQGISFNIEVYLSDEMLRHAHAAVSPSFYGYLNDAIIEQLSMHEDIMHLDHYDVRLDSKQHLIVAFRRRLAI